MHITHNLVKTMASDIDQNKLKVAIDWINKLANGMNPLDGSTLPDSDRK